MSNPPPPTRRDLGTRLSLSDLRELARRVGFPDPALAAAVAMAESGGNPLAVGDSGTSFGLWQIHVPAHPEFDAAQLGDPLYCAQAAFAISSHGRDWTPWTTFRDGSYQKFMGGET